MTPIKEIIQSEIKRGKPNYKKTSKQKFFFCSHFCNPESLFCSLLFASSFLYVFSSRFFIINPIRNILRITTILIKLNITSIGIVVLVIAISKLTTSEIPNITINSSSTIPNITKTKIMIAETIVFDFNFTSRHLYSVMRFSISFGLYFVFLIFS